MGSAQAFRAFADRVFGIGTLALYAWARLTLRRWLLKDKHFEPCAGLERQSGCRPRHLVMRRRVPASFFLIRFSESLKCSNAQGGTVGATNRAWDLLHFVMSSVGAARTRRRRDGKGQHKAWLPRRVTCLCCRVYSPLRVIIGPCPDRNVP